MESNKADNDPDVAQRKAAIARLLKQKKALFNEMLDLQRRLTIPQPISFGELLQKVPLPDLNLTNIRPQDHIMEETMLLKLKLAKFCGVSVKKYTVNEVVYEFSVAISGRYCVAYHMKVERKNSVPCYIVSKYNLPYNVNMKKMLKEMPLTTYHRLNKFVQHIQHCCETFHYRKQQITELKNLCSGHELGLNIFNSHDYKYVKIGCYADQQKKVAVTVHLMYQYNGGLPSDLVLECDDGDKAAKAELETRFNIFKELSLSEAIKITCIKQDSSLVRSESVGAAPVQQSMSEESASRRRSSSSERVEMSASSLSSEKRGPQTRKMEFSHLILKKPEVDVRTKVEKNKTGINKRVRERSVGRRSVMDRSAFLHSSQVSLDTKHKRSHKKKKIDPFHSNVKRKLFQTTLGSKHLKAGAKQQVRADTNISVTLQSPQNRRRSLINQNTLTTEPPKTSIVGEMSKHDIVFTDETDETPVNEGRSNRWGQDLPTSSSGKKIVQQNAALRKGKLIQLTLDNRPAYVCPGVKFDGSEGQASAKTDSRQHVRMGRGNVSMNVARRARPFRKCTNR